MQGTPGPSDSEEMFSGNLCLGLSWVLLSFTRKAAVLGPSSFLQTIQEQQSCTGQWSRASGMSFPQLKKKKLNLNHFSNASFVQLPLLPLLLISCLHSPSHLPGSCVWNPAVCGQIFRWILLSTFWKGDWKGEEWRWGMPQTRFVLHTHPGVGSVPEGEGRSGKMYRSREFLRTACREFQGPSWIWMMDSYKCILGDFPDGPVLRVHLAVQAMKVQSLIGDLACHML